MPDPRRNPNIGIPLESVVHRQVCDYIRLKWPDVIFNSDMSAGKLSRAEAGTRKMLRSTRGFPDLQILRPKGQFFGLFLELKRENATVYLQNGKLSTSPHIQEQAAMLNSLMTEGYYANFALGFEDARTKIDWYMGLGVIDSSDLIV